MTTSQLNDRLWKIAKIGVPATLILLLIGVLLKFRVVVIATDVLGIFFVGIVLLAVITEVVMHIEKRDKSKNWGDPNEGPADR